MSRDSSKSVYASLINDSSRGKEKMDSQSIKNGSNPRKEKMDSIVSSPLSAISLLEKLDRVMHLLMKFLTGGVLVQVWRPIKDGTHSLLRTSGQPHLVDHLLYGFRQASEHEFFYTRETPGVLPQVPGRVFMSSMPEWTPNVIYYNSFEYTKMPYALHYRVRGSLAMPIIDPANGFCCAVLELVTTAEKPDFNWEIDIISRSLMAVDLRTAKSWAAQQVHTGTKESALADLMDILRDVCRSHELPLALTWIPCFNHNGKKVLNIQESACYANDPNMQGFLYICSMHWLEKGKGIAGKALESTNPYFCSDVKKCDIWHYPMAHHARKFGLQAAVAMRLRNTSTGNDDYILEFFLPVSCKTISEQQILLKNLVDTMRRICKSFRLVSVPDVAGDAHSQEIESSSIGQWKRKPGRAEEISLDDIQGYFSYSLKDAAMTSGVSHTRLKRICRRHGILRWPCHKIKKANNSLKNIRNLIEIIDHVALILLGDMVTESAAEQ